MHAPRPIPGYCRHKSSNRGYAQFGGRRAPQTYFPGPWNSPESLTAYRAACAEWQAGGRPGKAGGPLTVRSLLAAWWPEAETRYTKFGRPTDELHCQKSALRFVRELYADRPAEQFGPQQLAAVRQRMIDAGWVRASINLHVCRIRTVWRWGVSQGLVPVATLQMLCTLAGLRKGKSAARESQPKAPVSWRQLLAVLRRCRPMIGAMVRLQFLTGMRPGEVCALRPCDLDRSGDVWKYKVRDEAAKTGNEVYWLGPRAVAVLAPWLLRAGDSLAPVFARYSTASYRRHIARCCREAGVSTFGPHQLRHAHATRVEDLYGREAAQKRLNHTQIKTTSRYTRTADRLVQRIAREMG